MTSTNTFNTRLATRLAFLVAGFGVSCWAPMVPFAKQRLQVDDGTLGLLLLCLGIGSVLAMVRTGPLCGRYGSKPVILAGAWGMVFLLPVLALVSSPVWMAISLFAFGAALGTLDVAMNVHAVQVERDSPKPLMSGFHALFSVGGFAGASVITTLLNLSFTSLQGALVGSVLMAVAVLLTAPRLMAARPEETQGGALLAIPKGPVVLLSVLAAITFLVEGALLDWSALLLTDTGLASSAKAGLGYAMFSVAMTVGRFSGDSLTARWGDKLVVLGGSLLAILGFVTLLTSSVLPIALTGFVLIGLGLSNVVPVLFRKAGAQDTMSAAMAVSAITTVGYAGYLSGPALLGGVAKMAGLPMAFWLMAALLCAIPLCAKSVTAR